jgi:Skp family chaperone for outer membrane proteins
MKAMFCVLAAMLALGFWRFDPAYIPTPRTEHDVVEEPVTQGAAKNRPGTKVAMIDISEVFEKYSRAIEFREDLEDLLQPYKDKAARVRNEIVWLENATSTNGFPAWVQIGCQHLIQKHQTSLEHLDRECVKAISARREDNDVLIWNDIKMCSEAVAKAYGFQIVLGYRKTKRSESSRLFHFSDSLNFGGTHPFFILRNVDITDAVATSLDIYRVKRNKRGRQ